MVREIPLTNSELVVIVDDEDVALVMTTKWSLVRAKDHRVSYARSTRTFDGKQTYLHNLIFPAPDGLVVDHIDFNGLNNRRANLRHITNHANSLHRRLGRNNKSGYRGVSQDEYGNWLASITHKGRKISLGRFMTTEAAARAFDAAARDLRGEMAELNFPDESEVA